jgi:RimJ/RimL family protein N-acetyltransferase
MEAMSANLFQGERIRLVSTGPEEMAKLFSRWDRNSFYARLLDDAPRVLFSEKKNKELLEENLEKLIPEEFMFSIFALDSQKVVGFVGLWADYFNHGIAWLGIGIGEPEYWGKGYGTEAVQLMLKYAFTELNLHRVSLDVLGYNQRAIRSYEKNGFVTEGMQRKIVNREGKRWDVYFMGVLREDWIKTHGQDHSGRLL